MTTDTTRPIRAIIVDDEAVACNNLRTLLQGCSIPVTVCDMARDTIHARRLLQQHTPDVVFLDIEMPNENGLQLMQQLDAPDFDVVFVTAYDEHAITAFKLNAVDYILKPVNTQELNHTLRRLQERLLYRDFFRQHPVSYGHLQQQIKQGNLQQHIVLRDGNEIEIVLFKDILYVEANGSYSSIAFLRQGRERSVVMSYPIADYEKLLPASTFFRIHRSYLVNCAYAEKVTKDEQSYLWLKNGHKLPISRRRQNDLLLFLGNHDLI